MKGSLIGEKRLKQLFPNFNEDIGGNGIDLRIGEIATIIKDNKMMGSVDDTKYAPSYHKLKAKEDWYELLPRNYYFITIDREIHIPKGYCQTYYIRSTFSRCGLILLSSVGDSDFKGILRMGLYNASPQSIYVGKNERIIQAVTWKTDGSDTSYNGSYQDDKFYN